MTEHSFSLIPFPDSYLPVIKIAGTIARVQNFITVRYFVSGKIEDILFPKVVIRPGRRDELWLATCFEYFLAIPGQPRYWEFNFSPSGNWNAFRMDAYRRVGFRQEELIRNPKISTKMEAGSFQLEASLDVSPIMDRDVPIQAGITSVIQARDGHESYWALSHPNSQADFHVRESFTLVLEGSGLP